VASAESVRFWDRAIPKSDAGLDYKSVVHQAKDGQRQVNWPFSLAETST
jgi:hypothetical protein